MMLMFKEWSKENVKTRTARSRTREGNSICSGCAYILVKRFCDEFHLCRSFAVLERSVRINSSSRKFSNQLKPISIATFSVTVGACLSGQPDRPRAAPHPPAPGTPTASSPPSPRTGLTILAEMTLGGPI
ncbi:hypothetical protein T06_7039 [Trichinella sp. T6]|nr:hypothetical protein T06_7039 [Trichinella sp. T6]